MRRSKGRVLPSRCFVAAMIVEADLETEELEDGRMGSGVAGADSRKSAGDESAPVVVLGVITSFGSGVGVKGATASAKG